jgi:CDP-glycerol glycerophosphotransferase (TagB/SpsB family)
MFRRLLIDRVAQEPDYSDRFLLFPLHYHDDAQMTFREPLLDQYDLIREVSRALPSNVCLYVKPHPHYSGIDVTFSNLSKIRSLRNVKVIKPDTPTVDLIKQSKAVITVNSTTGFEALILGIPVVTFGHDFYCKEPFCYVVRDRNAMAQTFTDALSGRHAPKREEVQEFIKTVYGNQIWADEVTHDAKSEGDSYDRRRAEALDKVIGNHLRQDSRLPSLRAG